jgi:hypothetical protein
MSVSKEHRERLAMLLREISEELVTDGVIIAVTRRRRRTTETFAVHDGNLHTVRGIAEFVYGHFCEDQSELEEEPEAEQ